MSFFSQELFFLLCPSLYLCSDLRKGFSFLTTNQGCTLVDRKWSENSFALSRDATRVPDSLICVLLMKSQFSEPPPVSTANYMFYQACEGCAFCGARSYALSLSLCKAWAEHANQSISQGDLCAVFHNPKCFRTVRASPHCTTKQFCSMACAILGVWMLRKKIFCQEALITMSFPMYV